MNNVYFCFEKFHNFDIHSHGDNYTPFDKIHWKIVFSLTSLYCLVCNPARGWHDSVLLIITIFKCNFYYIELLLKI